MSIKDFFTDKGKYDSEGFDKQGYNRLGYDRMGYDREGYDVNGFNRDGYNAQGIFRLTGRDKDGYDAQGFDENGFDRNGFNKLGYDKEGFDQNGFDSKGFDRNGFDIKGFDAKGYNRRGFDKDGYDRQGFDEKGFDKKGFNKAGFDQEGFDKKGFDVEGYNRDGFNKKGFDRDGYDKNGYNQYGYDRDGYDKKGFNTEGFDREGYDKKGFDASGYNRDGFDKKGYDREGYDREGFNADGIDREGFNTEGFDSEGFDKEGYGRKGFNRQGVSRLGFRQEEFDDEGYHKITGYDVWGYSRYGFNVNGINKFTGRDRLGFNSEGIDEDGFSIWGLNLDKQVDIHGNPISIYDNDPQMTEELCAEFELLYYQYMAGKNASAIKLANCFCTGKGTVKDYRKTIRVLVDIALEHHEMDALRELSDHFYIGDIIEQNILLANYFNDIVDNKKLETINQYKARQALSFMKTGEVGDSIFREEQRHLQYVIDSLERMIQKSQSRIKELDDDTSWMDRDQLSNWREEKLRNIEEERKIEEFEIIKQRPYYARMDVKSGGQTEKFYIGEHNYSNPDNYACEVVSVWSDMGRRYRDTSALSFSVRGCKYDVVLRRKLDIVHGNFIGYYDEYVKGSKAANASITDPFLLHILEEKRSEKNITNIIRSIQKKQNDIIDTDFTSNIIVQGCAGSGKTMILLHRLANMKYNMPKYDWSRVKIITPNRDFSLFIDELSKDLRIDEIERITLQDYYLTILQRYDNQFPEKVYVGGGLSTKKNFLMAQEKKKTCEEDELEHEVIEAIYSDEFREDIEDLADEHKRKIENFGDAMDVLMSNIDSILESYDCRIPKITKNYNCMLYCKVLFMYCVFGPIKNNENMLCIDEGQDICEQQYLLLFGVNGEKTCLNIYGDLAQRVSTSDSISSWIELKQQLNAKYFELNENYRNSDNIVEFYGKSLGIKNHSFGLRTKDVEQFEESELDILLKLQLILGNRTVIITNSEDVIPTSVLSICKTGMIADGLVSIMTVKQVKGLEFDTAIVFDEGMNKNEKYIAYTRALSELYVDSRVGNKKKAPAIKPESEKQSNAPTGRGKKKNKKLYYPEVFCDEEAEFYEETELLITKEIYLTLTYPEVIDDCFVLKMSLRVDVESAFGISASAKCIRFYGEYSETKDEEPDAEFFDVPIFVPQIDAEEQVISLAIPLDYLPKQIMEQVVEDDENLVYEFSMIVSYQNVNGDVCVNETDLFSADMRGVFIECNEIDEEPEEDVPDDEVLIEEPTTIQKLKKAIGNNLLIVVREGWSNDFCFVVEKFDGSRAKGSQYLNGNFHKRASYNALKEEFSIYHGPSRSKIEDQYE